MTSEPAVSVDLAGHVATVEIHRPPHNWFDIAVMTELADAVLGLDDEPRCRALVLCSEGKNFCAGADLKGSDLLDATTSLYEQAARLFSNRKPIVAAVQGAAVGGGLGLALVADFRVTCAEARFCANFSRLGFHPGFGLTATLPRLVGPQKAALMFYTGRRVPGDEAVAIGLADVLAPQTGVRAAAAALATEIAQSAPLAVVSMRETLRRGLADAIEAATERELVEQEWQRRTEDFKEGVKAMADRRLPDFKGR
jgi:enoyl-CoA hydratase/carnithine racemase